MSRFAPFVPRCSSGWHLAATTLIAMLVVHALPGQTPDGVNWQGKAVERLKAIYERGEFRAKNYRPTWLSDSSGFVTQEQEKNAKEPTRWFYEAKSGKRRAWKPDEKLSGSDDRGLSPQGTHRLATRGAKLLAINLKNRNEIQIGRAHV